MKAYEEQQKILHLLKINNKGLTVGDIAKELKFNRNSSAKYLDILFSQGHVELRQIGPAKLYFPAQRVPMSKLLDYSSAEVFILDEHHCVLQINETVSKDLKLQKAEIVGKSIFDLPLNAVKNEEFVKNLKEDSSKAEVIGEYMYIKRQKRYYYRYKILKACFDSGNCGYTIIFEDISGQKEYEYALEKSAKLNEITSQIASDFIFMKKEDMEEEINTSLYKIVQNFNVDRVFICLFDSEVESFKVKYYSKKEEITNSPFELNKEYPLSIYSFWLDSFSKFEICFLHEYKNKKEEYKEKEEFLKNKGVKSMLGAPMISDGNLIGFVGFVMVKKSRHWSETSIEFARNLARLYSQILKKKGDLE
ncbi:MAG: GAF domain-containing protein [Nanoarchaeota archaeon]|nr:GAF domain-containing protein [Nanoarchaeota archaeon]MEC8339927.1 GAF domain-containing protein [Nanoarchaeota archaeon]